MTKEKIDYSKFICPANRKHTLRKSTSSYCDVWCDNCVNGWKISELSQAQASKNHEFLLHNQYSRSDFYALYLKVTPDFKKKLLKLKDTVSAMEYNMSLNSPERDILSSSYAIEENGLSFQNDLEEEYKEEIENNLPAVGVFDVSRLKKPVDTKHLNYKILSSLGTCIIVVSHKGFKIAYDEIKEYHSRIETSVIPWNKLD